MQFVRKDEENYRDLYENPISKGAEKKCLYLPGYVSQPLRNVIINRRFYNWFENPHAWLALLYKVHENF